MGGWRVHVCHCFGVLRLLVLVTVWRQVLLLQSLGNRKKHWFPITVSLAKRRWPHQRTVFGLSSEPCMLIFCREYLTKKPLIIAWMSHPCLSCISAPRLMPWHRRICRSSRLLWTILPLLVGRPSYYEHSKLYNMLNFRIYKMGLWSWNRSSHTRW